MASISAETRANSRSSRYAPRKLGCLRSLDHRSKSLIAGNAILGRCDSQSVEAGQKNQSPLKLRLLCKVLDRGPHAVSWRRLGDRVAKVPIDPARGGLGLARHKSELDAGLPVCLGDAVRVVIKVASSVWPPHVVEGDHRGYCPVAERGLLDQLELVIDREPVVVPVDQGNVDVMDVREGFKASRLMKDQMRAVALAPPVNVDLRPGIDGVQNRVRRPRSTRGPSRSAAPAPHRSRPDSAHRRFDDVTKNRVPEAIHGRVAVKAFSIAPYVTA